MCFVSLRPSLRQTKIRKLRIVFLQDFIIRCITLLFKRLNLLVCNVDKLHTVSSNMFDVLKSLYMTGSGPLWRKAKPLAAASAILILFDHGRGIVPSKVLNSIRNFALNKQIKQRITTFYTIQSSIASIFVFTM